MIRFILFILMAIQVAYATPLRDIGYDSEVPTVISDPTTGNCAEWDANNNLIDSGAACGGGAVDSVNGYTGVVVLDPDDLNDTATTNKFTTAADITKLSGIEAGATANDTDANLKARANHTGTQLLSTISDAGTAAALDVPATGDAAVGEVVKGDDSRLTDSRMPTSESDPQVGTLTNTNLCTNDGTQVNCTVNTEAEFESSIGSLNFFSTNDGALNDDNLANNQLTDLNDVTITSPLAGDILVYDVGSLWKNLAAGTSGYFLKSNGPGFPPSWAAEVDGSTTNEIQNIFETISTTSGTAPVADSSTDTLTITAGSGIAVTGDSSTDTVTIAVPTAGISLAQQANMATASVVYRKTAGSGAPEVNTLATLKTDLGLTGTNTGDQDLSSYQVKTADFNFGDSILNQSLGNIGIGRTTFGTSANNVIGFNNGTAPTTSPTDTVQIWAQDTVATESDLYSRNEDGRVERLTGLRSAVSPDVSYISTATYATVDDLTKSIILDVPMSFKYVIFTTSDVAAGFRFRLNVTPTISWIIYEATWYEAGAAVQHIRSTAELTALGKTALTTGTLVITGTILTSTSGTLLIQAGQNVSNAAASTILEGSYVELKPIGE